MDQGNNEIITESVSTQTLSQIPNQQVPSQKPRGKLLVLLIGLIVIMVFFIVGVVATVIGRSVNNVESDIDVSQTPKIVATTTPIPTMGEQKIELVLKIGEEIDIPASQYKLRLDSLEGQSENCADCISTTNISVIRNDEETTLIFSCGGFAGTCDSVKSHGELRIELQETIGKDLKKINVYIPK